MNVLSKIIKIALLLIAFYFFVWPFINSALSHNYYFKINTDGSSSTSWISEIKGVDLSVEVYGRGNIASDKASTDHETYTTVLDQSDINKIAEVINQIRGMHILVRLTPGFAFRYTNDGLQEIFFSQTEKQHLLELAEALEYYARGEEVIKGSGYKTALEYGRSKLDTLRSNLGL